MSRNLIRPRDQYVIWLYEQESIIISYHTARFGGYKHCGCEDKTNLICQLILEDQVIKDSCVSFTRRSPSTYVTILQSSGGHKHWGCEDIMILVWHMILEDHVIKRLCNFMGRTIKSSYHCAKFDGIGTLVVKI